MTDPNVDSPLARQRARLAEWPVALRIGESGVVDSLGDGIAWVSGLPSAAMEELIGFADGSIGLTFQLASERIGCILLRQASTLAAGAAATLTGQRLRIGVGDALCGRVVDPLGAPLDGEPTPPVDAHRLVDAPAPPILARNFVRRPLHTGNLVMDALLPIGKGQRQLLIGDNGTGKSALALDTVLNQRGRGVRCVYVLIGQKRAAVVATIDALRRHDALAYTTVVVAEATALPGMKYLAPYAGTAIAEFFMARGEDALVVHDDLSTHARAYRELSLLLRRPPGREAYPGDVFFLHARLLERATCLSPTEGGGSLTALALVETEQGDVSAYIPTNLISISDGQVVLDQSLFARGQLPAIDVARSVSRIGGKAQDRTMRAEAARIKLDYLQFLELEVFTRFGSRLETSMEQAIARGRVLREILKQPRLAPLPIGTQLAILVAFNLGLLDGLEGAALDARLAQLRQFAARGELSIDQPADLWREHVARWLSPPAGPIEP
jgi:F-type H+-transporting ATPase subunit alpha